MTNTVKITTTLIIGLLSFACTSTKHLVNNVHDADQAFAEQNYELALAKYEEIINVNRTNQVETDAKIFENAGISAYYVGNVDKTNEFLDRVRHREDLDPKSYVALAWANRQIDNLSREITALEAYVEKFPDGDNIEEMKTRLFETYVESMNWEPAYKLWDKLDEDIKNNEAHLNAYFKVISALEMDDRLDEIAENLFSLNPLNEDALYHLGKKYFWKAENRYQKETKAYEQNRTHRQYAALLKGFEVLNADFRKSLDYFLKLYEVEPKAEYARYIGNIYMRFNDEGKANFYFEKTND
jgi:tetratricopeptide (TPR) repeat protein